MAVEACSGVCTWNEQRLDRDREDSWKRDRQCSLRNNKRKRKRVTSRTLEGEIRAEVGRLGAQWKGPAASSSRSQPPNNTPTGKKEICERPRAYTAPPSLKLGATSGIFPPHFDSIVPSPRCILTGNSLTQVEGWSLLLFGGILKRHEIAFPAMATTLWLLRCQLLINIPCLFP